MEICIQLTQPCRVSIKEKEWVGGWVDAGKDIHAVPSILEEEQSKNKCLFLFDSMQCLYFYLWPGSTN